MVTLTHTLLLLLLVLLYFHYKYYTLEREPGSLIGGQVVEFSSEEGRSCRHEFNVVTGIGSIRCSGTPLTGSSLDRKIQEGLKFALDQAKCPRCNVDVRVIYDPPPEDLDCHENSGFCKPPPRECSREKRDCKPPPRECSREIRDCKPPDPPQIKDIFREIEKDMVYT